VVVEEAASLEETEHAALEGSLKLLGVAGGEVRGLVEGQAAVGLPGERPSRTTTWKWRWGLRAEPKRWRKETAPS
jgi:hypothetical protein